jgi:hypothetical protein
LFETGRRGARIRRDYLVCDVAANLAHLIPRQPPSRRDVHTLCSGMSSTAIPKVVPAQLSFLAVYNPSLGTSDETFHKQIVFYYSRAAKARSKLSNGDARRDEELREQENEKLRQVGLAQGMVGFAKSFSNGEAVDSVETQKSRIVLHELEAGWWILAVSGACVL